MSCQLDTNHLRLKKVIKYEGCPHSCKRHIFLGLETTSKHIIFPHLSFFIQGNTILKLYYCPSEDNMKIILFFHMSLCKTRHESFTLKNNSVRGWAMECLISHISKIWPPRCPARFPSQFAKHSHYWTFKSIPKFLKIPPPSLNLPNGKHTSLSPPSSWPCLWGSIISLTPAGRPGHPPLSLSMQNRVRTGGQSA